MRAVFLSPFVTVTLIFQAHAQEGTAPYTVANAPAPSYTGGNIEYAIGPLFFYERNWGVRGIGIIQEGQFSLSSHLEFTVGISMMQTVYGKYRTFDGAPNFETYSSIIGETGLQISPFSKNGRFRIGINGMYQYKSEVSQSSFGYEYVDGEIVNFQVEYDTEVANRVGYAVGASYQLWQGNRFSANTALKLYTFEADFFAEILTVSVQAGYRF